MKEISLAQGDFKAKDAMEILTAYIHVEISLYQRNMELENDLDKIAQYADSIHRLQKILFEACEFIERKNGAIHLSSKLDIS
jgi:hypothetical protein